MTALPIVARELKVRSTHAGFHWTRAILAGLTALVCLQWFVASSSVPGLSTIGRAAFHSMTWIAFVLAFGATIVTADCVSQERREGTLGLLFLTTLKSRDVVLGKFAAMGLTVFYALLGFAPVLMLPLVVGGVTGGEVARTALALLNLVFVALALGLWVSVYARGQMAAMLGAFAALAFLSLAPFFLQLIAHSFGHLPISVLSPTASFFVSDDAVYSKAPLNFWLALGVSHAEGWLFLAAATIALAGNWREIHIPRARKTRPPEARRLLAPPRVVMVGRENKRRAFAPVARAVLRMRGLPEMAWLAAFLSLIGSLGNAFAMHTLGVVLGAGMTMVFTLFSSALFAFVAGRFLFEARRSGELELLLVTPVGARGILREQRFALLRMLRGPFYLAVIGSIAPATSCSSVFRGWEMFGLLYGLALIANVVLGIIAIACVGMWFGTRANSSFGLIGAAVGLVEILPMIVVNVLPVLLFGALFGGVGGWIEFWVLVASLLIVGKNLFFIWWARRQLRREFRTQSGTTSGGSSRVPPLAPAGILAGRQPGLAP